MPKAIVMVGSGRRIEGDFAVGTLGAECTGNSLANLEVLGQSLIRRIVDDLKRGGVESIAVVSEKDLAIHDLEDRAQIVTSETHDLWEIAGRELLQYRDGGGSPVLIMRLGAYVEFDIADLLQFQAEREAPVVRAFDNSHAFDIWGVDAAQISDDAKPGNLDLLSELSRRDSIPYEVRGYSNPLESPRDLRRLVVDSLNARCQLRPHGFELRPGVWVGQGAQLERDARIVAPAFIGRDVIISQQCLITRGSNIERNSLVDYGTVIENTSVLPNSYVGIGLDVCHSIVDGNKLLNLQRDVLLEIEDSAVMRQNKPLEEAGCRWWTGLCKRELMLSVADESTN